MALMECSTHGAASQSSLWMVWCLARFHWEGFSSVKWKTSPLWFYVSNKTMASDQRTEHSLSFVSPESHSLWLLPLLWTHGTESFLQMNNYILLYSFVFVLPISTFFRKCPSTPSLCKPRTWRATLTLACPTQPLPSSPSQTSMTTHQCWPPEL